MPVPTSPTLAMPPLRDDGARVEHTRLRLRMLSGQWQSDLQTHIRQSVGELRAKAWGPSMLTACPLADLTNSVSVLYEEDVAVSNRRDPRAGDEVEARWMAMGARASMQAAQRITEATNECARMLHIDPDTGRMRLRAVTPDLIDGKSDPLRPGVPVEIGEWCLRMVDDAWQWVREVWSVEDPAAPFHRVYDYAGKINLTGKVYGDDYAEMPWPDVYRWADGRPWIPWSLTHSLAAPPALLNPWVRSETVDGTMVAARHSALIDHSMTHAAWPQRGVANMVPIGAASQEGDGGTVAQVQVADPTSILMFEFLDDKQQGMQWQWDSGAEIDKMQDVYERRLAMLAQSWGLSPADLVRSSADPRSGVALSLSRAGTREVQRRRAPIYRPHDQRLAAMTAAAMNRLDGGNRPEAGYHVEYALLPLSTGEQAQLTTETLALLDRGLILPAEARARILGENVDTARAILATARAETTTADEAGSTQ